MKLTADDRLDILELAARYSWAADTGDAVAFAASFADHCEVGSRTDPNDPATEVANPTTPAEIEADFESAYFAANAGGRHQTGNHVIEVVDGVVHHRSFWSFTKLIDGVIVNLAAGTYHDVVVRDPDRGWVFARRIISAVAVSDTALQSAAAEPA